MSELSGEVAHLVELAKGLTDACLVLSKDGAIIDYNRPFIKLFGIPRNEFKKIKGARRKDYVHLDTETKETLLEKCLTSQASVRLDEVHGKTNSGENLNLIVTAVPLKGSGGEVLAVLESYRDVTDEARIHDKYKVFLDKEKRAKEELERQVQERTKELRQANEELKRAESQLVHSEKMSSLGAMVAGIAHELNNPINFIYGNTDSLEEYVEDLQGAFKKLSEVMNTADGGLAKLEGIRKEFDLDFIWDDLPKIVRSIRTGSERSADIIQGLRTFSRLDEAQLKSTDLHADIDTTLVLLHNKYKDHITVEKEYGDLPAVTCFSGQLNQVFMNLLHNAIQAIEGEGKIWIRTWIEGENVKIEIRDSGKGMSEDVKAKIFDPFFTTKDVGEGTGLGLSISYGVIEKHQGQISVSSEIGKGTTFAITLPIHGPEIEEEGSASKNG